MNLYLVIRYGSDLTPDGPNGPDTIYLVRAESHLDAEALVIPFLELLPHKLAAAVVSQIQEIGTCLSSDSEPGILFGPFYQHAYNKGFRSWYRMFSTYEHPLVEAGSPEDPFEQDKLLPE